MQQEELKRQKLDKLNSLLLEIPEHEAKSIAVFIENKMDLLKVCYDKSEPHHKAKIHELITYTQLRCFLTGEKYTNTRDSKYIKLKDVIYSVESIKRHIKEKKLPEESSWKAIDIYSFYFGDYRVFFRCFGKGFLDKKMELDKEFIEDVFSQKDIDSEETGLNQHIVPCQKLNIIPSIRTEKSVLRIDILENLFNVFQNNKKVAITGISGIGKTFLAKHFTEYYEGKFSNMVWLNCANGFPKAFSQEKGIGLLGSLGLAKEYDSYLGNEKGLMNLVIGHLAKIDGNNLLVLDNLDERVSNYKDEIAFLSTNWNILGTSQRHLTSFENYIAPDFKKESLDLFYTFYTVEKDDDNLIRLLSAIEYHTLAIELLAKTADERNLSIIALVNRFTKKGINVVEQIEIDAGHGFERGINIENIEEYLNIIFDTSSLKEEQCKILLNIALMQEDSIPMELFEEVYLNNSSEEDIIDIFNYNLKTLVKKGWIKVDNERIRLHGLVKSIIIKRFLHRNEFFDSTVKYLRKVLANSPEEDSLEYIEYVTLAESLLENITEETEDIKYLTLETSTFYIELGLYEKAQKKEMIYYLNQLKKTENISDNAIEIIANLYTLSSISISQSKYEDSLQYSQELYSLFDDHTKEKLYTSLIDSLNSFFNENKINNLLDFESKFSLTPNTQIVDMILHAHSEVLMLKDENKELTAKIRDLESVILRRQEIVSIFEKNISEQLLSSIKVYKGVLFHNIALLCYIGLYYLELGEYDNAEALFKKALKIQEKIFINKNHHYFSYIYCQLAAVHLKRENLEEAKHLLQKSKEICSKLPSNHSSVSLYIQCATIFEELVHKKNMAENLEKIIKSRFNILDEENQDPEYYNELSSIYLEHEAYEKANQYIMKEIDILLGRDNVDCHIVVNLYIKSGMCYLHLDDFDGGLESYNKALALYKEEEVYNPEIESILSNFYETITGCAFNINNIPIISSLINVELSVLEKKYIDIVSETSCKDNLLIIIKRIFSFLFELSELQETLEGIETTERKMEEFLESYNSLVDSMIIESTATEYYISTSRIQYTILDEYYHTVMSLFLKYEKWEVVIQFFHKRLFLNQKYSEDPKTIGAIYYDISCCHFNLKQYELALEALHKVLQIYGNASEDRNNSPDTKEQIKTVLKNAFALEKMIKEELEKFKKM